MTMTTTTTISNATLLQAILALSTARLLETSQTRRGCEPPERSERIQRCILRKIESCKPIHSRANCTISTLHCFNKYALARGHHTIWKRTSHDPSILSTSHEPERPSSKGIWICMELIFWTRASAPFERSQEGAL